MSRLLTLNLDFVLMLQIGLWLLLATAARSLAKPEPARAWRWLGAYGLAHAFHVVLTYLQLGAGAPAWIDALDTVVPAAACLFLLEFARAGTARAPGRWVHLPATGALTLAVIFGGEHGGPWCRYAISVVAGLWSAAVFWRWSRAAGLPAARHALRRAALLIAGFQLLAAPVGYLAEEDEGSLLAGVPPLLIACACQLVLVLALTRYKLASEEDALAPRPRADRRRRRALCGAVVALIVLAGWLAADHSGIRQDTIMREQILARTQLAAAAVSPADVRQLFWDERDLTNPAYLKLKALMMSLRHSNPDLRFVLLAGLKENRSYFLMDSESPDSPDYSPPGQSYDEATPAYLDGIVSRKPFVNGPDKDRWGTWVSGSVPLVDEKGDTHVDVELDIAASDWDAHIRRVRFPVLLITLLFAALVLGSFRAMERLRESAAEITLSEHRNRSLVEGSPDCVQMFDLAGRYLAVNRNGLRALGLPESAVLGRHFADLWPADTRAAITEAVRATAAGRPTSFEADYVSPDGRTVTWRVATNPVFDDAGRVVSFVGICVDLTVRKQAELAMLAARRAAEEATLAKSEFLAVMSHEIRTPLAGIIGMLELLQQAPLESQPRRYTAFARDSADSLMHLLDDVLDTAKFEAGKLTLEAIPFRPHEQFEAVFGSAAMRAAAKGLAFRHVVGPTVPALLVGDPTRLRQIINNLVNNALKFTEHGGVNVTLDAEPAGLDTVRLRIAVRDTGIGIPEETRARLFAKFVQADTSTTRRFGGTGLGLSIVKNLAELMDGEVHVDSALGEGATFTFSAPLAIGRETPAAPADAAPPAPVRHPVSLRVLIVDDDESNRTIAEALVTGHGHRAAFAVNGREAVNRLTTEKFDVVLMDKRMPIMDGLTATRLIRDPATGATDPDVYIVALTANTSADDRAKCLAAGMNDFATKPVRAPAMALALTRALAHLRARGTLPSPLADLPFPPPSVEALPPAPPIGLSEDELLASLAADEATPAQPAPEPDISPATRLKITDIFLRETPRRLATLHAALGARDAVTFGIEAHALKGNARYFRAEHLVALAARMETLADENRLAELPSLLADTEHAFAQVRDRLVAPAPV